MSNDADSLSFTSREFYEVSFWADDYNHFGFAYDRRFFPNIIFLFIQRAKIKVLFSICLGAASLAFLGFSSQAGGMSAGNANLKELPGISNDQKDSYQALVGGYGFAAFWYELLKMY